MTTPKGPQAASRRFSRARPPPDSSDETRGFRDIASAARCWARRIKRDVVAVHLAARHPRVPWYAKLVAGTVAAYALSPVDLIPDFIPVVGYLDDLVIVPLGLLLAITLIPPDVMRELRSAAEHRERPVSRAGVACVVALWVLIAAITGRLLLAQIRE
jgi:uncharacterized membrane protein YkvA (DUF1232 family)